MLDYEYYRQNAEMFQKFGSKDQVPLNCCKCHKLYYKVQRLARNGIKRYGKTKGDYCFCSIECSSAFYSREVTKPCGYCNKDVKRPLAEFKKSKSNIFCNSSCAAKFNNTHKTTGFRRSKLENYIEVKLKQLFPKLNIVANNVDVLNFELDFYFPDIKLAVELNGIVHYEPIYGNEKLLNIRKNDLLKKEKCEELGIELLVVDTTSQKRFSEKTSQIFLDTIRQKIINIIGNDKCENLSQ